MRDSKIERPLRIAVVMGKYVTGGIKSVIMNYYSNIDRTLVQFDFFIDDDSPIKDYTEILDFGGRVFKIPSTKHPIKNVNMTRKILKENNYKVVHGYLNTLNVFPMFAAFLAGTPVRISENLSTAHPGERKTIIKNILKPFAKLFPTHIAANSNYAGEWIYGRKSMERCEIIYNALDLNKYKYDLKMRENKRAELGLDGCFVLGHIGRYQYQKNHAFLIDVFEAVYKKDSSARLLLVGYGDLKDNIWKKIRSRGLENAVVDCGATEDIIPLYNAMDCFVLPSFYEGLPVVGIEAQATGLPCIISTEVTDETAITDNVEFIGLDKPADYWAGKILKWKSYRRIDVTEQVAQNGYSIKKEAKRLQNYYFDCLASRSK